MLSHLGAVELKFCRRFNFAISSFASTRITSFYHNRHKEEVSSKIKSSEAVFRTRKQKKKREKNNKRVIFKVHRSVCVSSCILLEILLETAPTIMRFAVVEVSQWLFPFSSSFGRFFVTSNSLR